jgi:hypothetical protein
LPGANALAYCKNSYELMAVKSFLTLAPDF